MVSIGLSFSAMNRASKNVFQFNYRGKLQEKSIDLTHLSSGVKYFICSSNGQFISSSLNVIYQ
jgi:hypothetical protein